MRIGRESRLIVIGKVCIWRDSRTQDPAQMIFWMHRYGESLRRMLGIRFGAIEMKAESGILESIIPFAPPPSTTCIHLQTDWMYRFSRSLEAGLHASYFSMDHKNRTFFYFILWWEEFHRHHVQSIDDFSPHPNKLKNACILISVEEF